MMTESTPYTPRSVLLTGGAGFIGSHVLSRLVRVFPEATFCCLDKLDYCASLRNLEDVLEHPSFQFVQGDITSADLVRHLLQEFRVDTVLHFAAETHVDNSFGNSIRFSQSNILGTHVLLECVRQVAPQVRRFIHVSTDEVYGENREENECFHERSILSPSNPYAATKAAAEMLVRSYHASFHLPVLITRGNNTFGPRQYPEKIIPYFISRLARGLSCTIHGDGSHRRSFLYIDDAVDAFELILRSGEVGETYNIGSDTELSTLQVAQKLSTCYGLTENIEFMEDRPFNDVRYRIDSGRLQSLGWKPAVDFDIGLERTIEWYRDHPNYWK